MIAEHPITPIERHIKIVDALKNLIINLQVARLKLELEFLVWEFLYRIRVSAITETERTRDFLKRVIKLCTEAIEMFDEIEAIEMFDETEAIEMFDEIAEVFEQKSFIDESFQTEPYTFSYNEAVINLRWQKLILLLQLIILKLQLIILESKKRTVSIAGNSHYVMELRAFTTLKNPAEPSILRRSNNQKPTFFRLHGWRASSQMEARFGAREGGLYFGFNKDKEEVGNKAKPTTQQLTIFNYSVCGSGKTSSLLSFASNFILISHLPKLGFCLNRGRLRESFWEMSIDYPGCSCFETGEVIFSKSHEFAFTETISILPNSLFRGLVEARIKLRAMTLNKLGRFYYNCIKDFVSAALLKANGREGKRRGYFSFTIVVFVRASPRLIEFSGGLNRVLASGLGKRSHSDWLTVLGENIIGFIRVVLFFCNYLNAITMRRYGNWIHSGYCGLYPGSSVSNAIEQEEKTANFTLLLKLFGVILFRFELGSRLIKEMQLSEYYDPDIKSLSVQGRNSSRRLLQRCGNTREWLRKLEGQSLFPTAPQYGGLL